MKSRLRFLTLFIALAPALPAAAVEGYVTDRFNGEPVRSRYGDCVHDYGWRPGMRFADCEPAPAEPVAAPAPQAAPVEEPPVAAAPQPIPQAVPFRLSLDALFDFDSAKLKPEGRAALDELAGRLAVSNYETLAIVGHADRIGAARYNRALSERRAGAVRDYLVAQGIDARKISPSGVGESQATAQCKHIRGARLIACLQPDRYAHLTVSGPRAPPSAGPPLLLLQRSGRRTTHARNAEVAG